MKRMKRIIALVLCVVLTAGVLTVLASCRNGEEENGGGITPNEFPTNAITDPEGDGEILDISTPEGWVNFAMLDDDDNLDVIGPFDLFTRDDETIVIGSQSNLVAVFGAGLTGDEELVGVHLYGDDREVAVIVQERNGRYVYARGRSAWDDPNLIDATTGTGLAQVNTTPGRTTVATTRANATNATTRATLGNVANVPTTRHATTTASLLDDARNQILNSDMTEAERQRAFRMLSYRLDENGVFYTERDPWQKQFGFNALFDMASPFLQLVYGTIRLFFRYGYSFELYPDGPNRGRVRYDAQGNPIFQTDANGNPIPKDWLMQFWKGRYGLVLIGAEIGVYTKPSTQAAMHFFSAVEEEYVVMEISTWQHNFATNQTQFLFTRGPHATWWITGFVPGSFHNTSANNRGKDEIITTGTLTFPSREMMLRVADALEGTGFRRLTSRPTRHQVETFSTSGSSIHFSWQYMDQDVPSRVRGLPS